ncbi:MAG: ribosome biogenesis GTP-binding protein YihA/YsxC [Blastocatellia bacterium]|nr:ribosome biogenesis GTP-binding protein YihA/YsxC [Blastocatellia bacterium]
MKIVTAQFLRSAVSPHQFPTDRLPEVAFLGRSNVGKSSLINSLLRVRGLAKTSSTPGRTQQINFFSINNSLYFVDLPGYGYARVPQEIRQQWAPMIERYITDRPALKIGILIVDVRLAPTELDQQMHDWLEAEQVPYCVVATKADKLSNNQLAANLAKLKKAFGPQVIPYSSITRKGADLVWRAIRAAIEPPKTKVSDQPEAAAESQTEDGTDPSNEFGDRN